MKLAAIFPGQGSQYVGMGKALFETEAGAKARQIGKMTLGEDFLSMIEEGPDYELNRTENTQPAILLVSVAAYWTWQAALKKAGLDRDTSPAFFAGHSLGEYSAYVAAGSLPLAEALKLVRTRGKLMEKAVPSGQGSMAAILGLDGEKVKKACVQGGHSAGPVEIANYNCPGQIVISGVRTGVEAAMVCAREQGAKRAVQLSVSGPFHSSLMKPAGIGLGSELEKVNFTAPERPVIANIDAAEVREPERIRKTLAAQISGAVQWEKTIEYLRDSGVDTFVECGPGRVLTGLVKKTASSAYLTQVEDLTSLEKSLAYLKESR